MIRLMGNKFHDTKQDFHEVYYLMNENEVLYCVVDLTLVVSNSKISETIHRTLVNKKN